MSEKIDVCGLLFDNVSMDEAVSAMEDRISKFKDGPASLLCVANQDILNRMNKISGLSKDLINTSFLIVPDGFSIVYAAKILGRKFKGRVAGPDLMTRFIEKSAKKGYKNYFLGAAPGVADRMSSTFISKYPSLKVCGIYSPMFGEFTDEENQKIIDMVNKAKPDVLWVSFGCPKQEKWILEHKDKLKVPIAAGIGAAFDFHSGNLRRAPVIMQKMRLEWFYRMLQEPKRLFGRYFFGGINLIKCILRQKFS